MKLSFTKKYFIKLKETGLERSGEFTFRDVKLEMLVSDPHQKKERRKVDIGDSR